MHKILLRQLKKIFGNDKIEALPKELQKFVLMVNATYEGFDQDRLLIERSLELHSKELGKKTAKLQQQLKDIQESKEYIGKEEKVKRATLNLLSDLKIAKETAEESKSNLEATAGELKKRNEQLENSNRATLNLLSDLKIAQKSAEESKKQFEETAIKERQVRIEAERMNKFMVARELKMVELKKEIKTLKESSSSKNA